MPTTCTLHLWDTILHYNLCTKLVSKILIQVVHLLYTCVVQHILLMHVNGRRCSDGCLRKREEGCRKLKMYLTSQTTQEIFSVKRECLILGKSPIGSDLWDKQYWRQVRSYLFWVTEQWPPTKSQNQPRVKKFQEVRKRGGYSQTPLLLFRQLVWQELLR